MGVRGLPGHGSRFRSHGGATTRTVAPAEIADDLVGGLEVADREEGAGKGARLGGRQRPI
jgi:hypothetical protein